MITVELNFAFLGHSAKYGTVSFMNAKTNKIVHTVTVQVNQIQNRLNDI